jgi:hypothetical protein
MVVSILSPYQRYFYTVLTAQLNTLTCIFKLYHHLIHCPHIPGSNIFSLESPILFLRATTHILLFSLVMPFSFSSCVHSAATLSAEAAP